jgi:DNA-binding GntR family transcriptional regulator
MKRLKRPPTLVEAAAESIREAIFRGDFHPGQPLRENELSQNLNISRGTVREALRLLKNENGLVESIPYRGTYVAKLTPVKVKEIYTLRALLESYAVRIAIENGAYTKTDISELRKLVARLGELKKSKDYAEDIKTDMKFHHMISRCCDHKLLLGVLNNLQSQILIFILSTKLYQSEPESQDISHQAILDGILSNDSGVAAQIVQKHITDAGSSLTERMLSRDAKINAVDQNGIESRSRQSPPMRQIGSMIGKHSPSAIRK